MPRQILIRDARFPTVTAESDVSAEVKALIRQMAEANVGSGAPRIYGELLKLGIVIPEREVSRLMPPRRRKPPSQTCEAQPATEPP